jgi:hypothetical protein
MKRLPWKYIAGFVDGEGCIDFQQTKLTNGYFILAPRVRVALSEPGLDVLKNLQNSFGGSIIKRNRKSSNPNWADAYSWELTGYKKVCMFLRNFVKHLIIKKEQARLLLWMETNMKGKKVGMEERQFAKDELSAMKKDPHRLSETAQERILEMLQSGISKK